MGRRGSTSLETSYPSEVRLGYYSYTACSFYDIYRTVYPSIVELSSPLPAPKETSIYVELA